MGGATGVNTTAFAYSAPGDFYYPSSGVGNCITRLTDGNSLSGNSMGASASGENNDQMWSTDRSYAAVARNGRAYFMSLSFNAQGCLQVNNPVLSDSVAFGQGGFSFSTTTPNIAYHIPGTGTKLYRTILSGTTIVSHTDLMIFDFANCPGMPSPFNVTSSGTLTVSADGMVFGTSFSNAGGQGTANWVLVARDNGGGSFSCATYYTGDRTTYRFTGNIWTYCTGNCSQGGSNPPASFDNTTCAQPGFGIHAARMYRDGLYMNSSGMCNGVVNSQETWQIGTNNLQWCNPTLYNCGGHGARGYNHNFNSVLIKRPNDNVANWARIFSNIGLDFHESYLWTSVSSNPSGDTSPVIGTHSTAAGLTTCGGSSTTPTQPYCFEIVAFRQDGVAVRFTPEFNSGMADPNSQFETAYAIGVASQDGYCAMWTSDWERTIGTDKSGQPRGDVFAICNLQ